ncbi:unnamed protein product [Adineta steineri]|uniref:DNA-directed RNA polymerase subunit n=2 Tax=Adineta steineri TaxID=433720 RepID=A0A814LN25_9BILA|nr:unnamed protein product [Adineta steineri]
MAPYRTLSRVQFGILSPDEIRRMSVTNPPIEYTELFEEGKPKMQGLMDPRQGPADHNSRCCTCSGSYLECPGHFGHIELVKPVYHIAFLPKILKILRCVCFHCSKLLIDSNNPKIINIIKKTKGQNRRRLPYIVDVCKNQKICKGDCSDESNVTNEPFNGCGQVQPVYRRAGLGLTIEWKEGVDENQKGQTQLSAERVLEIFKLISNTTCQILGMNPQQSRPEWMILTVLPVPPICVRPSVLQYGVSHSQDDLTYNLANIIKANNILRQDEQIEVSSHIVDEHLQYLQYSCATLINNDLPGMPQSCQKNGRPLKTLSARLKGKEGRIRGNLMGKRVDFSARTVITGDPNIAIDQVGVPRTIAQNLTVPEIVTPLNSEWLHQLIQCNGAKYIILHNGDRIDLRFNRKPSDIHLQYGYTVERCMMDDDLVVLNRQPTLHKMSMMCHRVKILPWSTFRLNLSVTTPYNADFDGDEMNLHLPQSIEAKAELSELMSVSRLLITPQSNRPVMGIVQDALTGVAKMTRRDVFLEKHEFMNLLMYLPSWDGDIPQPAILKPKPLWTGKQLFSLILPKEVNCIRIHEENNKENDFEWVSSNDTNVLIENGQLLSGILCKKTLGASAGSLGHIVFMECGHEIAGKFYSHIQLIVNNWLMIEGHSIGINDTITDEQTYKIIQDTIEQSRYEVQVLIEKFYRNEIENQPGNSFRQTFENKINEHLNNARKKTELLTQNSLSDFNQFKAMVVSGAKGNPINISQIIACVGQQNVEGKRIPFGFKHRTLPHFFKDDYGPEAKGFVKNSYFHGLTPSEFFFHAMGGREGLIDTAIKTAETGYIQRRLVKAMESIMVKYDGTVRNQDEQLIQFTYGEDGLAGENVEFQSIISLRSSTGVFENICKFDLLTNKENLQEFLNDNIIHDLFSNDNSLKILNDEWYQLCDDRNHLREIFLENNDKPIVLPCNIERLIYNARKIFKISNQTQSNLSPIKIIQNLKDLIQRLVVIKGNDRFSQEAQHNATMLMNILLRSSLCSQQILQVHHLTTEAFDWLCGQIETRFQQAQVQPGEMVGVLAAQSLGEPATQMTLNTFHFAGVSAKNVTLGVPRLKEIINLSKKPKTPSMTIFLNNEIANDKQKCEQIIYNIEHCTMKNIVSNTSIYYDPNPRETIIGEDQEWVHDYYEMPNENTLNISQWLLRIEFDREKMIKNNLTMKQISEKLSQCFHDSLHVIFTDDNAEKLVLHIRTTDRNTCENNEEDSIRMDDEEFLRYLEITLLSDLTLQGIESISKVYIVKSKKRFIIDYDGTIKALEEYSLISDGTSLNKVLSLKDIDYRRTYTNDIIEIFSVLGIEAARKAIENEMNYVLSFGDSYVNYRHLALLCDVMTTKGHLMSVTRHGINRENFSPIMRSSFEETVDVLMEAAAHAEYDPLKGVSESILLGQLAKIGTGSFELLLNTEKSASAMELPIDDVDQGLMSVDALKQYNQHRLITSTPWIGCVAATPAYQAVTSPSYTPLSPHTNFTYSSNSSSYTPTLPYHDGSSSPNRYELRAMTYSSTSPSYTSVVSPPDSTIRRTTSPSYSSASPAYNITSPSYSSTHSNPSYSPTSPSFSSYSASSPLYTSRNHSIYSSNTPQYNINSPIYTPSYLSSSYRASPAYTPNVPLSHENQSSVQSPTTHDNDSLTDNDDWTN